jgi:hypothetical protein
MKKFFTLFLFVAAFVSLQAQSTKGFTFIANQVENAQGQSSEEFHVFNVSIEDGIVVHTNFQTLDSYDTPASQVYKITSTKVDKNFNGGFNMTVTFKSAKNTYTAEIFIYKEIAMLTISQTIFYGGAFDIKSTKE